MSAIKIKIKFKPERFVMHLPDLDISRVENLARENGVTMSWLYRSLLFALEKKFSKGLPEDIDIHRPEKFEVPFRQTTICFHGDKTRWMTLSRIWKVELGPLLRFGLGLYFKGKLDLDLENSTTVKEVKKSKRGKMSKSRKLLGGSRYIYLFQNKSSLYDKSEFWPKNPKGNIFLMEWGLSNRIYPLNLLNT